MAVASAAFGCSNDSESATGSANGGPSCFDYSTFDGQNPKVDFVADLAPMFQESCGLSNSCHSDKTGALPAGRPYIASDKAKTIASLVGVAATADPGLKRIEPLEPARSFLTYKIDGFFRCAAVTCSASCGSAMPPESAALPSAQRDAIRRWIAQGAD